MIKIPFGDDFKLRPEHLNFLQDAYTEAHREILKSVLPPPVSLAILSGCALTIVGGGSPTVSVAAGYIYFKGEIFLARPTVVPSQGTTAQVFGYIDTEVLLTDTLDDAAATPINSAIQLVIKFASQNEFVPGQPLEGVLPANRFVLDTLTFRLSEFLAGKADKAQDYWIQVGNTGSPFSLAPNANINLSQNSLFARKDQFGVVHFRGALVYNNVPQVTDLLKTSDPIYQHSSTVDIRVNILAIINSISSALPIRAAIDVPGELVISGQFTNGNPVGPRTFHFDGFSYPTT